MKLISTTWIWAVALSLVAATAAYGGDETEAARAESGDCPCCESTTHCPVLRAAQTNVVKSPACGKSLSCPGMNLGGVTPRIIIQEEEEELLGVVPAAPDACKGTKCSSAATACKGKSGEIAKTHQIEIELELGCGAKTCSKSGACESQCQAGCEKNACCEAASTKTACSKTKCSSATAKQCTDCEDEVLAVSHTDKASGDSDTGHCGEKCACAEKCQCDKSQQGAGCCAQQTAQHGEMECPTRHYSRQTEQTSKALAELMERLGPSLIEGTEFERVPSFEAHTPDALDRPVSIREELVDYIRCLAAGDEATVESDPEVICTDQACEDSIAATPRERENAVDSLREAAMVLEQTAASLERNNLYDASDRTRELANQLRLKGRQLKSFDAETVRMQTVPASCQEGIAPHGPSKPMVRKPLIFGGVEVQY